MQVWHEWLLDSLIMYQRSEGGYSSVMSVMPGVSVVSGVDCASDGNVYQESTKYKVIRKDIVPHRDDYFRKAQKPCDSDEILRQRL